MPEKDGEFFYNTRTAVAERYTLRIEDLEVGQMREDEIYPILSVAWAQDYQTLIYARTVDPEVESPCQVYRHRLGTVPTRDPHRPGFRPRAVG